MSRRRAPSTAAKGLRMSEATLGLVLAGGLARRMGGGDKTLRTVAGRAILERVLDRLRPACRAVILNANGDPARFSAFGLPVVPDAVPGYAGPLAGVLTAMRYARDHHPEIAWIVSVAADTPFLPRDFVERLHAARAAEDVRLACAASGGFSHPVNALWPVSLEADLTRALIDEDIRKIDRFTARYPLATVEWPSEPYDPFFNANTPEDVEEAERLARAHPQA